jgi:hypothetical protein
MHILRRPSGEFDVWSEPRPQGPQLVQPDGRRRGRLGMAHLAGPFDVFDDAERWVEENQP